MYVKEHKKLQTKTLKSALTDVNNSYHQIYTLNIISIAIALKLLTVNNNNIEYRRFLNLLGKMNINLLRFHQIMVVFFSIQHM